MISLSSVSSAASKIENLLKKLFIGKRSYLEDEKGVIVEFDSLDSESWEERSQVSKYPIEGGDNVSDNVENDPITISLSGEITRNSDFNTYSLNNLENMGMAKLGVPKFIQGFLKDDLIKKRVKQLETWRDEKMLLEYFGAVRHEENLVITSFTVSRNAGDGESAHLTINLQKVNIADTNPIALSLLASLKKFVSEGLAGSESGESTLGNASYIKKVLG